MNIHEYQAKALLKTFGAPVAEGVPVLKLADVQKAVDTLPGPLWVVKSQIHAGGRGKGKFVEKEAGEKGGVRLAFSKEDVMKHAEAMLGKHLVTAQTSATGKQVNRLYIEDGADIEKELYLSILVDRATSNVAFVVSTEGGMDIEAVAHDTPEKIQTVQIDPLKGVSAADCAALNKALKLSGRRGRRWPEALADPLQGLHREGHVDAGGEPPHRHEERPPARARCESLVRRQRPVPSPRRAGAEGRNRTGRQGTRSG
jgi:succinyl-CoA synthetase beta subunit